MKERIHLVEDDADIRFLIEYFLRNLGYTIVSFESIARLKQSITLDLPDLYLIDLMLPDGSGLALCRYLKEQPATCRIPVLLMSAQDPGLESRTEVCADGFINKPFDLDVLLDQIHRHLSGNNQSG